MKKNLIDLSKECPDLIVQIRLGDLLEANKQLIALAKHELEQEIADSKAETYISREKVMEITGKSSTTIWRWQKINYLVPVSSVGGTYRYRMSDVRRIMEGGIGAGGFFRSMNRKIPHALDEHEGNTLGFDEVLIPGARQQVVDETRNVGDADIAIAIAISGSQVDTSRIAGQQVVDQGRYVGNRHIAVAVHVSP